MAAATQVAAIRECWPAALGVLKGIPAAVADTSLLADTSLRLKNLQYQALKAELESRQAILLTPADEVAGPHGFAPESRKVLVDEFKVGMPDLGVLFKGCPSSVPLGPSWQ